jgi:nucleoside-diphosphate-sugar epimerase
MGDEGTMSDGLIVVAGAGGFIGGHLVAELLRREAGLVRAVDIKPLDAWWQLHPEAENRQLDLREKESCEEALRGADVVYNLACDMGGMGFIENNKALCMLSVLINTHLLLAAREQGVKRYFYASSACVYAADKQKSPRVIPLKEDDAYPAQPEDGYGWEKLFSERMCRHFREDFGLQTRVARYHNVYGPHGTWDGGREKAPAAVCRKVIRAKLSGRHEIEIWGDGHQTRSFMFIDDCIKGTLDILHSDILDPINLGSDELVTINALVDLVEDIAGVRLKRRYNPDAPKGVNGRNSDNTRIKALLGWAPSTRLRDGLEVTYAWVYDQVAAGRACPVG